MLGARVAAAKIAERLGVSVTVERGWVWPGWLTLQEITIGGSDSAPPIAVIKRAKISLAALWGGGTVMLETVRLHVERGGSKDNVAAVIARLRNSRQASGAANTPGNRAAYPPVTIRDGSLELADGVRGHGLTVKSFDAQVAAGTRLAVWARDVAGRLSVRGADKDPTFGARSIDLDTPLEGFRPTWLSELRLAGAYVRVLPTLPLTGIQGTLRRDGVGLAIDLAGSYGGARSTLWTATGTVAPGQGDEGPEGALSLRAARFTLDRIAEILPDSILEPKGTSIDAALTFKLAQGRLGFSGNLDVAGLSIHHEKLAAEPIFDLSFAMRVDGVFEPRRRRLEIALLEARLRDLVGQISGAFELAPGTFRYADGSTLSAVPKVELALRVPKLPCERLLTSIPAPIVPRLQGFVMQGTFEADVHTKIDFANLENLELAGRVGIDGCRVTRAPADVEALAGSESIVHTVEVPPKPGAEASGSETISFPIGAENPDFVPFEEISPHIVNAIMTTEDGGFFRHRGWVSSEFRSALKRNLAQGGFRLGASSITMQTVKNVLLSHEKTLSRKLQELFLVWYIEKQLPKERILELYFNAIEFGPRLYGIGAAARHYFGKSASDITPLEAAFFSSILPSPKRRYIQYCHGRLYPPWEKYVRRILMRIHERGRITDEEYAAASNASIIFDQTERTMTEKACLDWIRRITLRPEPEPEPDAEAP